GVPVDVMPGRPAMRTLRVDVRVEHGAELTGRVPRLVERVPGRLDGKVRGGGGTRDGDRQLAALLPLAAVVPSPLHGLAGVEDVELRGTDAGDEKVVELHLCLAFQQPGRPTPRRRLRGGCPRRSR